MLRLKYADREVGGAEGTFEFGGVAGAFGWGGAAGAFGWGGAAGAFGGGAALLYAREVQPDAYSAFAALIKFQIASKRSTPPMRWAVGSVSAADGMDGLRSWSCAAASIDAAYAIARPLSPSLAPYGSVWRMVSRSVIAPRRLIWRRDTCPGRTTRCRDCRDTEYRIRPSGQTKRERDGERGLPIASAASKVQSRGGHCGSSSIMPGLAFFRWLVAEEGPGKMPEWQCRCRLYGPEARTQLLVRILAVRHTPAAIRVAGVCRRRCRRYRCTQGERFCSRLAPVY